MDSLLERVDSIVPSFPGWALGTKSARKEAEEAYRPEKLRVAGNWISGARLFSTCLAEDRKAVCRDVDARLCGVWVLPGGVWSRSRAQALELGNGAPPRHFSWVRRADRILCGRYVNEVVASWLVRRHMLRERRCPFFVETMLFMRTAKRCLTVMEQCHSTLRHLCSCMTGEQIRSVVRQVCLALMAAEKSALRLRFPVDLKFTSILLLDLHSPDCSGMAWGNCAVARGEGFRASLWGSQVRFPHHGFLVKMSGMADCELRTGQTVVGSVKRSLTPQGLCARLLRSPGLLRRTDNATKVWLSRACAIKDPQSFFGHLFRGLEITVSESVSSSDPLVATIHGGGRPRLGGGRRAPRAADVEDLHFV